MENCQNYSGLCSKTAETCQFPKTRFSVAFHVFNALHTIRHLPLGGKAGINNGW